MSPVRPFAEFQDTPLWHALADAVAELEATREITVATAPEYVVGYLCQQLVLRHAIDPAALRDDP
ncbi:MAG TPA: hypothetical protein VFS08_02515 [Gemmatimonadaceae bacterium]|nr:hypothetical protein [Gemmatimonadaceae bacterium]